MVVRGEEEKEGEDGVVVLGEEEKEGEAGLRETGADEETDTLTGAAGELLTPPVLVILRNTSKLRMTWPTFFSSNKSTVMKRSELGTPNFFAALRYELMFSI